MIVYNCSEFTSCLFARDFEDDFEAKSIQRVYKHNTIEETFKSLDDKKEKRKSLKT